MKFIKNLLLLLALILSANLSLNAQTDSSKWVLVKSGIKTKISVNENGLQSFKGDDFYAWVKEEFKEPFSIEDIDKEIYKTKTYYLFSKPLKRYSILQIIFYDEDGNVIKSYSYDRTSDDIDYKFNYPIIQDSDEELIFNKCLELINRNP